jgi:hypothetical protein
VFDGAADQLMMSLVRSERITPEEMQKMQAMLAAARASRGSKAPARKLRTTAGEKA